MTLRLKTTSDHVREGLVDGHYIRILRKPMSKRDQQHARANGVRPSQWLYFVEIDGHGGEPPHASLQSAREEIEWWAAQVRRRERRKAA